MDWCPDSGKKVFPQNTCKGTKSIKTCCKRSLHLLHFFDIGQNIISLNCDLEICHKGKTYSAHRTSVRSFTLLTTIIQELI